jgi:hypothetical protein
MGAALYKKLVYWELELENSNDITVSEILEAQKIEANQQFGRFIEKSYARLVRRLPSTN